jgi:ribosome-associated protein
MAVVKRDFRKLAKAAALAVDDKKAEDVVVLDVRHESDIADYMVIAGAQSSTQLVALSEAVQDALRECGVKALHREGRAKDRWLALDYGGLVVHLLLVQARTFYRLENLWDNARPVKWNSK